MIGLKEDPRFTEEQWKLLWNLLYNVTTNNALLNRETNLIELDKSEKYYEENGMILDPYELDDIIDFHAMEKVLYKALGNIT